MPAYIDFGGFNGDADTLAAAALDYLIANLPNWLPAEGHLEVAMIEALSQMTAEAASVAGKVPKAIFRYFGRTLANIPPIEATPASTQSTWEMIDNAGYTIPAGTLVAYRSSGDTLVGFHVVTDVVVPPGSTTTAAGEVILEANEVGVAGNGIPVGVFVLVDQLVYVSTVTTTATTSGGADAESDDAYLDRLADEMALLSPEPILPGDFAVLARNIPGVYRALALDGYDTATSTFGNERMVTVVSVDIDGNAVPLGVRNSVQTYLDGLRETNFVVNVMDPTHTAIDVTFTATALPGFVAADVATAAIAAVRAYLSPGAWSGGNARPPVWLGDNKVRYLELATVLNLVAGLDHVTALTIMTVAGDYTLPGVAPLPEPGVVTGTVT